MIKTPQNADNREEILNEVRAHLPQHILDFIEECKSGRDNPESCLISALHKVQAHFGYLGDDQMKAVSYLLGVPRANVAGVATFYHFFRLKPRGKYMVNVCMGTACYVKGAERVADRLKEVLGAGFGETSADGLFTLEGTRCVGTCGLAPVIMINDQVHGPVAPDEVPLLIDGYRKKAESEK